MTTVRGSSKKASKRDSEVIPGGTRSLKWRFGEDIDPEEPQGLEVSFDGRCQTLHNRSHRDVRVGGTQIQVDLFWKPCRPASDDMRRPPG